MKALYWMKDNWRYCLMALAAVDFVGNAVIKYLEESGDKTDWQGVAMAAGLALFTYLKKAPGDLTRDQAKQLAHDHASEALRSVSMHPGPRNGD